MQQARSRLSKTTKIDRSPDKLREKKKTISSKWIKDSIQLLPTLVIAILGYMTLWGVMQYVYPETFQNWIFPNSYLPFHFLLGISNFFLFSFLTHRKFWGFFLTVFVGWIIFLKLQNITLDIWGIGSAVILAIGASFWWSLLNLFGNKR